MNLKNLGVIIAKKRKEKGLTQEELGNKIGVSSKSVSKWECGINIPDIANISKISEVLDITTIELLGGTESIGKNKVDNFRKFIVVIIITILCILLVISFSKLLSYREYYDINLNAINKDYSLSGEILSTPYNKTIIINSISYQGDKAGTDKEPLVKNISVYIIDDEKVILGLSTEEEFDERGTAKIHKMSNILKTLSPIVHKLENKEIFNKNNLKLQIVYFDEKNEKQEEIIEIKANK